MKGERDRRKGLERKETSQNSLYGNEKRICISEEKQEQKDQNEI